ERTACQGFGNSTVINIRGANEIDAAIESRSDDVVDGDLVEAADSRPDSLRVGAEGHRSQADFRDEQARGPQFSHAHASVLYEVAPKCGMRGSGEASAAVDTHQPPGKRDCSASASRLDSLTA